MPLRIAFDMDGVLADFESAFREIELRLFGEDIPPAEQPEARAEEEERGETPKRRASDSNEETEAANSRALTRRKLDRVWAAIEATPNFWTTLQPTDPGAVRRIREMAERHQWEVFFITQRPKTEGETVQRQTQRWLVEQGFDWPSVLVVPASRGRAAAALHLDYLVDDSPKNCLDVISDSKARALMIVRDTDDRMVASAKRLGIGVAVSISHALDILEKATEVSNEPGLVGRLAKIVGWKD